MDDQTIECKNSVLEGIRRVSWLSGVFCVLVVLLLVNNHRQMQRVDPQANVELALAKNLASENPQDVKAVTLARALDFSLRKSYFEKLEFARFGAGLLVVGIIVFLVSSRFVGYHVSRKFVVNVDAPDASISRRKSRDIVFVVLTVLFGLAGLYVSILGRPDPFTKNQQDSIVAEKPKPPKALTSQQLADGWTRFRGNDGCGIVSCDNIPLAWDGKSGRNVLWKSPVALPGRSSPIVWSGRVFLSGATEDKRSVYCYDADSGNLLWSKSIDRVPGSPVEKPSVMEEATGYAAPSMATDGVRVFAIFANGDLVAFTLDGELVWWKNLGLPDNAYGQATSLVTHGGILVVQYDQGNSADEKKSFVYGIDTSTGTVKWKTPRPVRGSWSTPIVISHKSEELVVTTAKPWVIAYDLITGIERWRVNILTGEDIACCPVFAGGRVIVCNDASPLAAINPSGVGDVTSTHVLWKVDGGMMPDTSSPLATEKYVFLALSNGDIICYSSVDGKLLWTREMLSSGFQGSPSLVGDNVYVIDNQGATHIFEAADKYEFVAKNELGEESVCSPAFQNGRIFIRGDKSLFCIGKR